MSERVNKLSVVSQSARHQMVIAMALITVIPLLVLAYLYVDGWISRGVLSWHLALLVLIIVASIVLGYCLLVGLPLNIGRLRRYLETFIDGGEPEVKLMRSMSDMAAIEQCLNVIFLQYKRQVRRLEEEVRSRERAEALKDDFIGTVSHELRTPLAISTEGISLLLDGIPGEVNEKQKKILLTSRRNIDRLARIINDLLDISKIEAGMMELKRDRVNLVELVRQTGVAMEPLAAKKELALEIEVEEESIDIYVDADRMVQVLTNLLSNAVKFTERGGVHLSCGMKEGKAVCRVRDTGRGLSEEEVQRVFDKFTQFGRVDGAGDKGTGLGLTIVRNILDLHGGRIFVASQLGEGSTFEFEVPLYSPEKALLDRIDTALAKEKAGGRLLTLVLIDLEPAPRLRSDEWAAAFRTFFETFVQRSAVMRDSDLLMSREGCQVVFMGNIPEEFRERVAARWANLVQGCFCEVHPEVPSVICHATASLEADGETAEELLRHAESRLIRARQVMGQEKKGA